MASAAALTSAASSARTTSLHPTIVRRPFSNPRMRKCQQPRLRNLGDSKSWNGGVAMASGREGGQTEEKRPLFTKDDGPYFAKALGGCVVGAVAIKYGSLLIVPQLTESPSLPVALTIITTPVVVAAILLAYASSKSGQ